MADQGTGIAPQDLPKIFDPFFTTKETGTGLGLTAAHSIVQRHGGHLTVESLPNIGTTFILYLPAARTEPPARDEPRARALTGASRVLLMDDDKVVRQVGQKMLTELGFDVVSVRDGVEALELCQQARAAGMPFDLAVMDLTIRSGMGGAKAIRQLRELQPTLLAIAASGDSADPVLADPLGHGFDAALHKPYSVDELEAVLSTLRAAHARRAP